MKKRLLAAVILTTAALAGSAQSIVVADSLDRRPVAGTTVIARSGLIKGLTDADGRIAVAEADLPLTLRCMGYRPTAVAAPADTVWLAPTAYTLAEVVVTPTDRPVSRVVCFAREYSTGITGADTLQLYCEYMAEAFLVDGKVKGYRKADARLSRRNVRRYARIARHQTPDSIFKPSADDDIAELSWFSFMSFLPDERVELPLALRNGAEADTVPGKYGPKLISRLRNNTFTRSADCLSDHKNRIWSPWIFKLIGMTIDISSAGWTMTYAAAPGTAAFGIHDLVSLTCNIGMLGRGKWIKKAVGSKHPIEMNSYLEVYPVEITHLTVDEYRGARDNWDRIPFSTPSGLTPVSPAVASLVDTLDGLTLE